MTDALSPRHIPDDLIAIDEAPRTRNGKKCEVPVERVLAGVPLEQVVGPGALQHPDPMTAFAERANS